MHVLWLFVGRLVEDNRRKLLLNSSHSKGGVVATETMGSVDVAGSRVCKRRMAVEVSAMGLWF